MSNVKTYYSQPSSLSDDFWKRDFLHEIDLMANEMRSEANKMDELLNQKTSAGLANSFSQLAMKQQQTAGKSVLEEREAEERRAREEQQQKSPVTSQPTSPRSVSIQSPPTSPRTEQQTSPRGDQPVKKKSRGFLGFGKK